MAISSRDQAFQVLAKYGMLPPEDVVYKNSLLGMPIQEFIATQCYLEKTQLMPTWEWVNIILDLAFYPEKYGLPHFFTILYSTIKKSIKTTISSCVARWVIETWEGQQEGIFLASDAEQAKGRGYKSFRDTIEKHPRYDKDKRILYSPGKTPLWSITDREAKYLPDSSFLKPVSSDYAGEAGGNPTFTMYTELWTWMMLKDMILFGEMTIPPTRPKGFRFIDTYAGFTGKSSILQKIWNRLQRDGRQLTLDDIPNWPFKDEYKLPLFVDEESRSFGYIDQGINARRFPWQLGPVGDAYYRAEYASAVSEADYYRLHENRWADPIQALMPIQWWDNCLDTALAPIEPGKPVVIAADASLTHDCTAMSMVSRHPVHHQDTVLREEAVWDPQMLGGQMDYDKSILPQLVLWSRQQNIVSVVYDKYQLSYLMERVAQGTCGDIPMPDGSIATLRALPVREFNQQTLRAEADGMFVTMVRDRKHWHGPNISVTRSHILNAAAQLDTKQNTRLRIVKQDDDSKIDAAVSDSMANFEALQIGI